jgi:hypothetical protein
MRRVLRSLALTAVWLTVAGCGGTKMFPVEGKVLLPDGTPFVGATVEFESQADATKGLNARAEVGPDGVYHLKTGDRDGAVEGPHRILVAPPYISFPEGETPKLLMHPRFSKYETSGLEFTVQPGTNQHDIHLEGP